MLSDQRTPRGASITLVALSVGIAESLKSVAAVLVGIEPFGPDPFS
jgi:hypothetical protein